MTDPYKVLGVSPDASDEQIKAAYRELARKYHPDNYQNNPLADLANDKMQEINQAYDQIVNLRRNSGGSGNGGHSNGQGYGQGGSGSSQFSDIRRLIAGGRITQAEELLDGVPKHLRDAEWFFLKGSVQHTRGWLDDAYNNFSQAASMDPNNAEYRAALSQLQWQRQTGQSYGRGYRTQPYSGGCSICDICAAIYCADCCCSCLGGGC